jgi:hypothetical protein
MVWFASTHVEMRGRKLPKISLARYKRAGSGANLKLSEENICSLISSKTEIYLQLDQFQNFSWARTTGSSSRTNQFEGG